MDRLQAYRNQMPTEADFMSATRLAYEALGLLALNLLGAGVSVFGFACAPTSPASLSFKIGPGQLYSLQNLEPNPMGQLLGVGGLAADNVADHQILKQGLWRDTATMGPLTPPGTAGQSQVFLVEAQFAEVDDATVLTQFYNTAAPNSPTTASVSVMRRDLVSIQIKAGTAAATGSQVAPTADAGWTPLWTITLANGDTTITAGKIAVAAGAPFVTPGAPVPIREITRTVGDGSGAVTLAAGVLTVDLAKGNYFKVPMTSDITSAPVFNNAPPAGLAQQVTVEFIGDGTARTVTGLGNAAVKWAGATAVGAQPTFVFTANVKNKVVFTVRDGLATQDANFAGITAP